MISFPVRYPQDRVFRNRDVQVTQAKKFFPPAAIGRNFSINHKGIYHELGSY